MAFTREIIALDDTFGCLFIAGIFSTALWGAGSVQLYFYFEKYSKSDKLWLRLYTLLIWILDTVHLVLLLHSLYIYLVKEFANILYLAHPERTLIDTVIFAALVDAMVQCLFLMRIWHLSNKNYILTGILVAVVLAQFAVTTAYFGQTYQITEASELLSILSTERAMNAFVVVADTMIAFTLIFLLWKHRSGIKKTNSVVKRLVIYTVATGLVTSLWGIVGLVGAQLSPESFIYLLVDLVMSKLYLNCLLASLNSRSNIRQNLAGDADLISIHLKNIRSGQQTTQGDDRAATRPVEIECKIGIDMDHSQMASKLPDIEAAAYTTP